LTSKGCELKDAGDIENCVFVDAEGCQLKDAGDIQNCVFVDGAIVQGLPCLLPVIVKRFSSHSLGSDCAINVGTGECISHGG